MILQPPPATSRHHSVTSVLLDLLRGLAAIVVLVSHWKDLLFVPWAEAQNHSLLAKAFYAVTGGGHQAVIVFFVLSGYLITASISRSRTSGRWNWRTYLEHRFARLWTVLLPALLLVVFLDSIGLHSKRSAVLYHGTHAANMLQDPAVNLNAHTFIANLTFLQGIFTPPFGSDGALWSLSYEFWYYILFPLLLITFVGKESTTRRILYALIAISVAWLVGRNILVLFPVWLLGSAVSFLPRPGHKPLLTTIVAIVCSPLMFVRAQGQTVIFEYILGLATALLVWLILGLKGNAGEGVGVRASKELAGFSYTLYLVHSPLLVLLVGLMFGQLQHQFSSRFVLEMSPLLILSLVFAYCIAWCTEFRTDKVRRWFSSL